jgi:hypothetical protein
MVVSSRVNGLKQNCAGRSTSVRDPRELRSDAAGAARASEFAIILLIRINRNILTFLEFLITVFGFGFKRREPDRSRKVGTPQATR